MYRLEPNECTGQAGAAAAVYGGRMCWNGSSEHVLLSITYLKSALHHRDELMVLVCDVLGIGFRARVRVGLGLGVRVRV